jgi:DNA topoisomerase 6 subunit A-like protein
MLSVKITEAVNGVTKTWAKQRKAEERRANARDRRLDAICRSRGTTLKEAAYSVMADAYAKASGDGKYPANARQIMYAARGDILEMTGKASLDDAYFTQTLLPGYMRDHPTETDRWDVAYDARGHFREPHTDKEVPLGTLEVRGYLYEVNAGGGNSPFNVSIESARKFPTIGPKNRFSAILFIEKEGFMPLFRTAKISERFDIAIMSSKGQSVVACRKLADTLCGVYGIPLLLLRDFDIAGFNIAHVLKTDTERYEFENDFIVIDLGLRLNDVNRYSLESEPVKVPRNSCWGLNRRGATSEEIDFLCDGQRVELNAFTSDDFVTFIEEKLREHKIGKVIPKLDVLREAYRRAVRINYLEMKIEELTEEANEVAESTKVPRDIKARVRKVIKESDDKMPWDRAIASVVAEISLLNQGD